jgi:hypothetical protein
MTTDSRLKSIPSLYGGRQPDAPYVRRSRGLFSSTQNRRAFLRRSVAVGVGTGIAIIGLLPPARRAKALHQYPSETDILAWEDHGCPNYPFYESNDNSACGQACGPSTVHEDACFNSGNLAGFHRDHSYGTSNEWKLRPNDCSAAFPEKDGWKWKVTNACSCDGGNGNSLHRCHDGFHNHGTEANPDWHKSICKDRVGCSPVGNN